MQGCAALLLYETAIFLSPAAEVGCSHIGALDKAIVPPDICMKQRREMEERWGQIRDGLAAVRFHARRNSPVVSSSLNPAVWSIAGPSWEEAQQGEGRSGDQEGQ